MTSCVVVVLVVVVARTGPLAGGRVGGGYGYHCS